MPSRKHLGKSALLNGETNARVHRWKRRTFRAFSAVKLETLPKVSFISHGQVKDVGSTADLVCSVENADDYSVVWMKTDRLRTSDSFPISSKEDLIVKDERFKLDYNKQTSTYTLQIKNIQETDAGIYQCKIIYNFTHKIVEETDLQVRQPPVISENSTKEIRIKEGQSTRLECYATGFPIPTITWKKENDAILPIGGTEYSGSVLLITRGHKSDRGTYYCQADNKVGKEVIRKIDVEVEFAPVVSVHQPRVGQAVHFDIDLVCRVESYPKPVITWYKDSTPIINGEDYSISQTASREFIETSLLVLSIEKQQYGRYKCKATNQLGSGVGEIELFESIIPNINYRGILWTANTATDNGCHLIYHLLISFIVFKAIHFF